MSTIPDRYVLDANVFIQAKRKFYGFDFCPGYWSTLIWHQEQGRVCSIDKVPLVNVCRAFDVQTITPFELLRWLNIKLNWQPSL